MRSDIFRGRRGGRRLVAGIVLLIVAALTAAGTVVLMARSHTAGGPTAVHRVAGGDSFSPAPPDDVLPPGAPQPVTITVPVGPHLSVPILYYHYIRSIAPTPKNLLGWKLSITPQMFMQQMTLLHVEGAHTITLARLMEALQGETNLPPHPVILTFDDGYADFATTAHPALARYGFIATDFVVSGFVGRRSYMTAAQVRAMDAAGMVIGSHTVHHVDLVGVPLADAAAEIDAGKAALERLLGHGVLDFAYPSGGVNLAVMQLVQRAGFRDAVTTIRGDTQALNGRFLLQRFEIGGAPSLTTFAREAGLPVPTASQWALIAELAAQTPSPKAA
jgi:peptidoglycan/xylan/chitin deacetylase (PgdA/CDA1 family)